MRCDAKWGGVVRYNMEWYGMIGYLCYVLFIFTGGRLKLIEGLKPITGCKYLYFITVSRNYFICLLHGHF